MMILEKPGFEKNSSLTKGEEGIWGIFSGNLHDLWQKHEE
jgi:hypothetical protein